MNKFIRAFGAFFFLTGFLICALSFAQESNKEPAQKEATVQAPPTKLSREEMIDMTIKTLDLYGDELLSKVPYVVKKTDEKGSVIYLFKKESGEEVAFKDLDDETLITLYRNITNAAHFIQQERLRVHLEQIRKINEQNIIQQQNIMQQQQMMMQQQRIFNMQQEQLRMQMQRPPQTQTPQPQQPPTQTPKPPTAPIPPSSPERR